MGDVRGIVVSFRNSMLADENTLESPVRQGEEQRYRYSILLHRPSRQPTNHNFQEGDGVTLTVDATKRFFGGVLKSKGDPEGGSQSFPVGVVAELGDRQAKVCLRGSTDSSWYAFSDLSFIDSWDKKFQDDIPEDWLRDVNTSFSSQIEHMSLRELLQSGAVHHIPVFQRRYCWTKLQWVELWRDLTRMRDAGAAEAANHSLGRVLMRQREDGSRLILDGQQRMTTISLLLSALHDRAASLGEVNEFQAFLSEATLIPTLDDRADFQCCLREVFPKGNGPLLEAKRLFSTFCQELDAKECSKLISTLLLSFSVMVFVLQTDQRLQIIYHMMSEGWGTQGSTPGIEMSPIDFIRNFVLENFGDEQIMRRMHSMYWSPLETRLGPASSMEEFFKAFLSSQGFRCSRDELYDTFESWWKAGLPTQADLSEYAEEKLREMLQFTYAGAGGK